MRMGRMTVVMPFQRSSCWMAKAVSLWRMRLMMPGPAEDGLAGEDGRSREFVGHALAQARGRLDDVDARVEARLGREAEAPGQVDVLLEGVLGRRGQAADGLGLLERARVHLGHGDEDEVLVEAGEAADDGQEGVDAEARCSR